jgi:hypothetical protein
MSLELCKLSSSIPEGDVIKHVCFSPTQPLKINLSTKKVKKKPVILCFHIITIYIYSKSTDKKNYFHALPD